MPVSPPARAPPSSKTPHTRRSSRRSKPEIISAPPPTEPETATPQWKSLFVFTTKKEIPLLVFASSCSIVAGAASPAQAFITGKVFDLFVRYAAQSIEADDLVDQQRQWILYLVAIGCASWVFRFLELAAWMTFGEVQAKNARTRLFRGLSKMDIAWYDLCENGIQALLPRLHTQIKDLKLATSQPLGGLLSLVSTSLIALAQAFYNSWDLTLVTLAGAPLIVGVIVYFGYGMQKSIDHQQSSREATQKHSLEFLSNIETVKCFNAEEIELQEYRVEVACAAQWYHKIVYSNALQMAFLAFLVQSMFVQAFYYGGVLIRDGKKQSSQVVTTFFSAITAFQAIQGIIPQMVVLEKGRFAGATLPKVMPATDAKTAISGRRYKPFECKGNIQLRSVSFSYPSRPAQPALDNVNLVLPGGNLTFLIGKSGSGKSTIGQLLVRFYDPHAGNIMLDGEDLLSIDTQWLRSNVTLVEQMSTLFEGSISENIAFGCRADQTATKQDIDSAVEFALLQRMLNDMPDGLDTKLDQRGESISGGQRQRIALARARLRDTSMLILDESTSALDQISRELMMEAIRVWRKSKTTIIVTHDISQIRPGDYAIILDQGKVVQEGYRRDMELIAGSPFTRFVAARPISTMPALHRAPTYPPPGQQSSKQRTSFFSAASVALETLPFHGFRMSPKSDAGFTGNLPMLYRPPTNSDRSVSPASADTRTLSQRMQDLIQDTGQWALANRKSAVVRRRAPQGHSAEPGSMEKAEADKKDHIATDQSQPSLLQMLSLMRRELPFTTQTILAIGYFGGTVHAACSPVFAFVLAKLLGLYSQPQDTSQLSIAYSLAILGVAAIDATAIFLYRLLIERASQTWVDSLRRKVVQRLLGQPQEFFDISSNDASGLVETLDYHAEEMRNLFGRFIVMLYSAAVILVISFIWALASEWKMTLMAITAGPYIFVVAKLYTRTSEKWERLSNDAAREVDTVFTEAFGKVRTVRLLALETHFHVKFAAALARSWQTGCRRALLSGFFYGMSNSSGILATALVFYVGTKLVHDGASVMAVLQVFTILIMTISNVTAILDYVPQMGSAKEMAWRVLKLAVLPNNSHERQGDTRIQTTGQIEFRRLNFAYPGRPDVLALKNVTFDLKPGITTAVVGGSGSGKSTVAKLLLKLYSAAGMQKRGGLMISGRAVDLIDTRSLRRVTAVVAQTSALFGASIKANIAYGLPADIERQHMNAIINATKQAGIYDFITSLPDAFDTMIGPGGMGLSGGQVQRIAIARALVRSPSLLILDEATSALDAASAALVRETIHDLVRSRDHEMTIVMITHNREMMEVAEHVVVLDHGCVVESGSYEALLNRGGHLTNLLKGGAIT